MGKSFADYLELASIIAHQLRSPVAAADTILQTLLAGYGGPLSEQQKRLIEKAHLRCNEAVESAGRTLAVAQALHDGQSGEELCDVDAVCLRQEQRWLSDAAAQGVSFSLKRADCPAAVHMRKSALIEAINALIDNAFKYTPSQGRVRLSVERIADGFAGITVEDSGVGVAVPDRDGIFAPFARSPAARDSARHGSGLGLAFVKALVESAGGSIAVSDSPLGGARFEIRLPLAGEYEYLAQSHNQGEKLMQNKMRVLIIGGVAAGPKVASKVIRMMPEAEVTIVEKGEFLSYAGCGLPYYVSGVVKDQKELMCTPVGAVRDPVFFQKVKNVRVLNHTEALEIDRKAKRVRVKNLLDSKEDWLGYDKLMFATGATPVVPPIPNIGLENIFTLHGVHDAEGIKALLAQEKAHDVTVIGGGLIGVEATEALVHRGCRVTIIEMLPQILRILDWDMAKLVERHMESHGVKILTGRKVESFEGDGSVSAVVTDDGVAHPADMVVLAIGVRPNVALAQQCGLEIGPTRAIKVDEHMQTSDPDIYAAGDCAQSTDMVTGKPCYVPLGSTANKQGRVAAVNICGGNDTFPGVLGSTVCKVFDYCVARTGLTETAARESGFDVVTAYAPAPDKAHFMPEAKSLFLKLVVDPKTRKLLGAQANGPGEGAKRVDVAAMAITSGMTVDQLANADLCYAPPYAPAMDNIITAANVARNKLDGIMKGITPAELRTKIDNGEDILLLDVRSPAEYEEVHLENSKLIPLGTLRERLREIPKDKEIITYCQISLRGYEAALILEAAGFKNVKVMDGGVMMWPYEKIQ